MDMRMEQANIRVDMPCGTCTSRFQVEGDVTVPGSLREAAHVLYASALAVEEGTEAFQDRVTVRGRVIFSVVYTQGESRDIHSMEATAEFTHACDMPGVPARAEVMTILQAEQPTAVVRNGRMNMRVNIHLRARAVCPETMAAITRFGANSVQHRLQQLQACTTVAKGKGDVLLRDEFSLPADLAVRDTLCAWASVRMTGATGGQGRIGLSGEVTLEALHSSDIPGKPVVMTRHTIPVGESVEISGESGELLDGSIRIKDVAVASQEAEAGERTLRAEILLGLTARADKKEQAEILEDAYTVYGDELRLTRAGMRVCRDRRSLQAAESGKLTALLPEGSKPLQSILAAFASPVLNSYTQQGSRLMTEGVMQTTLIYMSDDDRPASAKLEAPFRMSFPVSAAQEDLVMLAADRVEAIPLTSDRVELRYILRVDVDGLEEENVNAVLDAAAVSGAPVTQDMILYYPQRDEGVWEIAKRYRISEGELRAMNPELQRESRAGKGLVIWHKDVVS